MSCFPCFGSKEEERSYSNLEIPTSVATTAPTSQPQPQQHPQQQQQPDKEPSVQNGNVAKEAAATNNIEVQIFSFKELANATNNFRQDCLIGEGGFGRVYKGQLEKTTQIVAIKQLDRNGLQGNKDFSMEVATLSQAHHPNLVNLIGYCADGEQRLLVYEFIPSGSLDKHVFDLSPNQKPLDWHTRMKVALGAAQGLQYLHDKANPPIIFRDLKSNNILVDEHFNAKLCDFGLAKLGFLGDKTHVPSKVMGADGYCAPEYQKTGHLTVKSDVYSFGVVMLELITGRRVIDNTKPSEQQNLIAWAQPVFREPKRFPDLADPSLGGQYAVKSLNQVVAIAAMCLQEEETARPLMSDVVTALTFLSAQEEANSPSSKVHPHQ